MTQTLGRLRPLTVSDVMSTAVVTIEGPATFHEMATLMQRHAVSALPVMAEGRLVGIVSEADLMLKEAPPAEPSPNRLWPESHDNRVARAKSKGISAADVMSTRVVTVHPGVSLSAAAHLMREHAVKRLPVVDEDGALVGLVSRRDLLSVFTRSDEDIRRDIVDSILPGWLGIAPGAVTVVVSAGIVGLRGSVARRSDVDIVKHVVASLDGVVRVDPDLTYAFDDRNVGPGVEARVQ